MHEAEPLLVAEGVEALPHAREDRLERGGAPFARGPCGESRLEPLALLRERRALPLDLGELALYVVRADVALAVERQHPLTLVLEAVEGLRDVGQAHLHLVSLADVALAPPSRELQDERRRPQRGAHLLPHQRLEGVGPHRA